MSPDLQDQAPVDQVIQVLAEGRYLLEVRLGRGGTAEVWRATDTALDVPRAVKLLLGDGQGRETLRRRLRSEARAMAKLEHPHILRIYDIGVDQGRDYIVMDLAEGGSLADLIDGSGPLPPDLAIDYGLQILSALSAAHTAGIVHRDVKPQNVLRDHSGRALLADFGIALLAEDAHRKTRTGVAMGSLAYMAPEQRLDARSVGPEADIYAMGTSLFHLLTGENPVDLFAADLDSPRWASLPEPLREVLFKATRYEPAERYPTARDMALVLLELRGSLGTEPLRTPEATDPSTWSRPSARLIAPPAATVAEATGFAITWFGDSFQGLTPSERGAGQEELARRIAALIPDGPPSSGPTIHPEAPHPTLVAHDEDEVSPRRWLWAAPVLLLLLLLAMGVAFLPGLPGSDQPEARLPADEPAHVASSVEVEPRAPPVEEPPAVEEAEPAVAEVSLPEPAPQTTRPRPRAPAGPPPLGTWKGTINARELQLVLGGTAQAITGTMSLSIAGNQSVIEVGGRFTPETRTLVLEEVGDGPDTYTYTATLEPELDRMEGKAETRDGRLSVFTARRIQ